MPIKEKLVDDSNACRMEVLDRAIALRCDSMNIDSSGNGVGRVGAKEVELGDAKEFINTYSHLLPNLGDSVSVMRSRDQDGSLKLRMTRFPQQEIGVHLLWS